ncbi:MAG TPA: hypothetical protein VFX17_02080 [Patescibacteria group bacterium]|nr:hypothetical protein [Patescibacteria group bacterium]
MTKLESVVMRFIKGFVAGGLGSVGVLLSVGIGATDLKKLGLALLTAFISGGLLAIEKAYNWQN